MHELAADEVEEGMRSRSHADAEVRAGALIAPATSRPSPALGLVREFGVGALAGFAVGALVGGLGSRIAMRISGFAAGPEAIGQLTENGNAVGEVTRSNDCFVHPSFGRAY